MKTQISTNKLHEFTRIKTGQGLIEYTVVITCIVAALLTMQFYIKRALQGRLRSAADQIGDQYDPGKTSGTITTTLNRDITSEIQTEQSLTIDGKDGYATLRTETINNDETVRKGDETIEEFGLSLWE